MELVDELVTHQPVCVAVTANSSKHAGSLDEFRFTIEHRIVPSILFDTHPVLKVVDGLRLAAGVRLNRYFVPLTNATRTASYHLQFAGPEGTYLVRQELVGVVQENAVAIRMQPRRGQRRAHLYLRGVESAEENAMMTVAYAERSPGSLAQAVAGSWAATILILALATTRAAGPLAGLVGDGASDGMNNAVIAALLAVPVGVSTWNRTRVPLHPTLLSRGFTLVVVALSLLAFLLAVIGSGDDQAEGARLWTLLLALSAVVSVFATGSWISRLALEFRFIRRAPRQNLSDHEVGGTSP